MTDHRRLQCDLHDGRRFIARARTTGSTANKEEFLLLDASEGEHRIRLDLLHAVATVGADGQPGARDARAGSFRCAAGMEAWRTLLQRAGS
ncbi:Rho-binding antiterminator [Stenotrophomonas sp. NPDC077659]|uniref:Rho-binding antiterminator n=1 Tax=Stenotrophomonas sp. NPDC077659 TaxID=3390694 RepID=UPI003CFFB676